MSERTCGLNAIIFVTLTRADVLRAAAVAGIVILLCGVLFSIASYTLHRFQYSSTSDVVPGGVHVSATINYLTSHRVEYRLRWYNDTPDSLELAPRQLVDAFLNARAVQPMNRILQPSVNSLYRGSPMPFEYIVDSHSYSPYEATVTMQGPVDGSFRWPHVAVIWIDSLSVWDYTRNESAAVRIYGVIVLPGTPGPAEVDFRW